MARLISISVVFLLQATLAIGQEEKKPLFEWKGYMKDLPGFFFPGQGDSMRWMNLVHNRVNLKVNAGPRLTARVELRNRVFFGSQVSKTPGFGKVVDRYPGFFDLSWLWVDRPSWVAHSVVDRLSVAYSMPKWDIVLGRQRINWGVNNVWNPNDIFNAYNFLDFDYEERPGNDAVRIQHQTGGDGSVEFAWKPGRTSESHVASLLYKFNRKEYDYQFLGGLYNADWVVGAGWAGSIGEKGFKGEASYFHPRKRMFDTTGVLSASVMMDHTLKGDWYLAASVLYNSRPTGGLGEGGILSANLSAKSLFPFRWSFYLGAVKNVETVCNLSAAVVYSPTDNSLILFPSFSWNASESLDLDVTLQSFFASDNGRYRTQGAALYLRGKWSF
jgi:hypothetical protein